MSEVQSSQLQVVSLRKTHPQKPINVDKYFQQPKAIEQKPIDYSITKIQQPIMSHQEDNNQYINQNNYVNIPVTHQQPIQLSQNIQEMQSQYQQTQNNMSQLSTINVFQKQLQKLQQTQNKDIQDIQAQYIENKSQLEQELSSKIEKLSRINNDLNEKNYQLQQQLEQLQEKYCLLETQHGYSQDRNIMIEQHAQKSNELTNKLIIQTQNIQKQNNLDFQNQYLNIYNENIILKQLQLQQTNPKQPVQQTLQILDLIQQIQKKKGDKNLITNLDDCIDYLRQLYIEM